MLGYGSVLEGVTLKLLSVSRESGKAISGHRLQRNSFLPAEQLVSKEGVFSIGIPINRTFVKLHLFVLSAVLLKKWFIWCFMHLYALLYSNDKLLLDSSCPSIRLSVLQCACPSVRPSVYPSVRLYQNG